MDAGLRGMWFRGFVSYPQYGQVIHVPRCHTKSRPHASQVLIAQPHPTAVPKFKVLLVGLVDAAVGIAISAPARTRVVMDTALVGREALLVVRRLGGDTRLGGARPQHPRSDVPKTDKPVIHVSLA
jgi:hypothetical protein